MKSRTKKPAPSVAEKTRAFAKAFPPHPRQSKFLEAVTALYAGDLVQEADTPMTMFDALERAHRDFEAAIQAVIFAQTEGRFYFIWARHPHSERLATHVRAVWDDAVPGTYGSLPPQNYIAKK